ncbi:MAG: type II toxin-antitoxin system VapC family toxin [Vicinamibacterales bacterium]
MVLPDVNVLIYAHRRDSTHHDAARRWIEETIRSDRAYGMSELVVSAFLRIVTHPRIFDPPSPMATALAFADEVMTPAHAVRIEPGPRHWDIFTRLCRETGVKGNLVADAYLAALAIEAGCEWVSTDGDFARFPDLVWTRPF